MKCRDLMKTDLQWVSGDTTVLDAARFMRDSTLGFLLVTDPVPGRKAGVVTDRDLAVRVCAEGLDPRTTRVGDVASLELVVGGVEEDLDLAEQRMGVAQKARLVIVDDQSTIVGLLSLTDILRGDYTRRAVNTANAVLTREARSPHQPLESIHLTPSTPDEEEAAHQQRTALLGGNHRGSTSEFPG